jgi:hypothetical protein
MIYVFAKILKKRHHMRSDEERDFQTFRDLIRQKGSGGGGITPKIITLHHTAITKTPWPL